MALPGRVEAAGRADDALAGDLHAAGVRDRVGFGWATISNGQSWQAGGAAASVPGGPSHRIACKCGTDKRVSVVLMTYAERGLDPRA